MGTNDADVNVVCGPVNFIDEEDKKKSESPQEGLGLCLSGGGYRAMLFHLGALRRLNEAGALSRLTRISSVSGGSIVSAYLGMKWGKLNFVNNMARNFHEEVERPIFDFAGVTVDVTSVLGGVFTFDTVSEKVQAAYEKHLYDDADLQGLPDAPRFLFNATCVKTGVLWRFCKKYAANYKIGIMDFPKISLAACVAASSAFPPVLSPATLKLKPYNLKPFHDIPAAPDRPIGSTSRKQL